MSTLIRFVLVATAGISLASAQRHSFYDQMKPFRTYFEVSSISPVAKFFDIWFTDRARQHCEMMVERDSDLVALRAEAFRCSSGAIALPPATVRPIPAEIREVAEHVRAAVMRLHPAATSVQVSYAGNFRKVGLREIIPVTQRLNPNLLVGFSSETQYRVDADFSSAIPYGSQAAGMYGVICAEPGSNRECREQPKLVRYRLLDRLEGTLLAYGHFRDRPAYQVAWNGFIPQFLQTIREIVSNTYVNPAEAILQRQGQGLLPDGFQQTVEYSVRVVPRNPQRFSLDFETVSFAFSPAEAVRGTVTVTRAVPRLGLTLQLNVSLLERTVVITATGSDGRSVRYRAGLSGELLVDHDRVGLATMQTSAPQPEDGKLTVAGFGEYSSVDVFANGQLIAAFAH